MKRYIIFSFCLLILLISLIYQPPPKVTTELEIIEIPDNIKTLDFATLDDITSELDLTIRELAVSSLDKPTITDERLRRIEKQIQSNTDSLIRLWIYVITGK